MSKEHFWPDWLKDHVPSSPEIINSSSIYSSKGLTAKHLQQKSQRQGHLITKKLRVVCMTCNNGWMSVVENQVKEFLILGIRNTDTVLDSRAKGKLAHWACIKTIVVEHSEPGLALTPADDRKAVIDSTLPSYFAVYLGKQSTQSVTWLGRHTKVMAFGPSISPPLPKSIHRNIQTVTFILGSLLFHVVSARVDGFVLDKDIQYPKMCRLWPPTDDSLDTASIYKMNASDLKVIVGSLDRYIAGNNARYGGDIPG